MPSFMDLTGKRFGRLTVIERAETKNAKTRWKCLCDCGKYTYTITNRLVQGKTLSCGCRAYEKHSYKKEYPRLYMIWANMRKRCTNPHEKSYERYGGRGISVCSEWDSFPNFLKWAKNNGYNDLLSIDRIDNSKGYSPDNCRWATLEEQANNKRNNIIIEHDGEKRTLSEWCRLYNFSYHSASQRYRNLIKQGKEIDFDIIFYNGNRSVKKVKQSDVSGNTIKIWDSLKSVDNAGYCRSRVSACCNGKSISYRGFIWTYCS